jgi:hypothetical protein
MKFLAIFLVLGSVFSEEIQPKTVGEAEMAYNREYNTAKEQFDARVKVAQDKLVLFLKDEMKRLTVKGDLDGAVAIRGKIKTFEEPEKQVEKPISEPIDRSSWLVGKKILFRHKTDIVFTFNNNNLFLRDKAGNPLDKSGKYFFDGKILVITPLSNSIINLNYDAKANTFKTADGFVASFIQPK